jgi:hypothetical protein
MPMTFFNPTPEERQILEQLVSAIPGIQQRLVQNHPQLTMPDRGAHQKQLAGGRVLLTLERTLPAALDGLGIFQQDGTVGPHHVGIGRISTGLGCPHAETDPDFLGLMVAFRSRAGRRVDFITINDPTSPTDTPEEFVALLQATADAAGAVGLLANQAELLLALGVHAGLRAPAIGLHVAGQTRRTVRSSSAYQQYWTGIVRARDTLGKFTFIPTDPLGDVDVTRSPTHLTDDWRRRMNDGPLAFDLYWIPFLNDVDTPTDALTRPWTDGHKIRVGTVAFPQTDPDSRAAKLVALLASELGANQGNWVETPDGVQPDLPATRFTAARFLAYRASQRNRNALADESYSSFFASGGIDDDLERTLIARYREKRRAGHWVPDLGDL